MLATALSSDARSHYYLASLAERWGVAPLVVIQLLCVILLVVALISAFGGRRLRFSAFVPPLAMLMLSTLALEHYEGARNFDAPVAATHTVQRVEVQPRNWIETILQPKVVQVTFEDGTSAALQGGLGLATGSVVEQRELDEKPIYCVPDGRICRPPVTH